MRVKCQVEIVNRSAASQGLHPRGKSTQSSLCLAKKPGDVVFMMHFTARDKQGMKYKMKKNIMQIFGKFLSEGKATVRLHEPPVDLCIKGANPVELKHFLSCVKMAHEGHSLSGKSVLSTFAPVKAKHVEKPKTKLKITSQEVYPITSSFSSLLETLQVHNCQLLKVDSRILALKYLAHLDLSNNKIHMLPDGLCEMSTLAVLNMAHNKIKKLPSKFCSNSSNLVSTLTSLDLSHNNLTCLPEALHMLKKLWQLNVSHNHILKLPQNIGELPKLQKLFASNNLFSVLPTSFVFLRLETLDLYGNKFPVRLSPILKAYFASPVLSLQEICGRFIRKHDIFYSNDEVVPYPLIRYLDCGKQCRCKNFCFDTFCYMQSMFNLRECCENLVCLNSIGQTNAPMDNFFCSVKCSYNHHVFPAQFPGLL